MSEPVFFGVRHLSPAAAWHVRRELDKVQPALVLIEGPSDLNDQMQWFTHPQTQLPAAILVYTQETPIRTLLYPFAVYSPEYQAILWAKRHGVPCRFMDLPSDVLLALRDEEAGEEQLADFHEQAGTTTEQIYRQLEELLGESHDTFWERHFEQLEEDYARSSEEFGRQLRETAEDTVFQGAKNQVREAYMKRRIVQAQEEGFQSIFCVCGAYHVEGLRHNKPLSSQEEKSLPHIPSRSTLMPYSYYRLSQRAGYGAGNEAPAYYELLWDAMCRGDLRQAGYQYLILLAEGQRKQGQMTSSAEVIEAARLAQGLAGLHSSRYAALQDLRDAAVTCMGHGSLSELAVSLASVEIGTKIGSLPDGVSRTSIQCDFYSQLKELHLEKYRTVEAQQLDLDLRENLRVKSERSAFLGLNRSFFLHRLRVIGIRFGVLLHRQQQNATWGEYWSLRWVPETEIEIVEAALLGETIEAAASFALKEKASSTDLSQAAQAFEDAFLCGLPRAAQYALGTLQRLCVDACGIEEVSKTAQRLSTVVRYGDLRNFEAEPIVPLLSQLFLRACLTLEEACSCDDEGANIVIQSIDRLDQVQRKHDFLEEEPWFCALTAVSQRDDLNTKCSGFAMAARIERGLVDEDGVAREVSRRLSRGVPAELAAGWFEGLAQKNHYSLIMRLSLWEQLDHYLQELDDEEFKHALVFLRRSFADFSANEKSDIAENLGEIWGIHPEQAANSLMRPITDVEEKLLEGMDEFDFDNI